MASVQPPTRVVAAIGVGEAGRALVGAVAVAGRAVAVDGRDVPVAVGGTAVGGAVVLVAVGGGTSVGCGPATTTIVVPLGVGEAAWSARSCRNIAAINPPLARSSTIAPTNRATVARVGPSSS